MELAIVAAPIVAYAPTAAELRRKTQGSSVPLNRVPWAKLCGDAWSDGKSIVDSEELAAKFARRNDIIDGSAIRL